MPAGIGIGWLRGLVRACCDHASWGHLELLDGDFLVDDAVPAVLDGYHLHLRGLGVSGLLRGFVALREGLHERLHRHLPAFSAPIEYVPVRAHNHERNGHRETVEDSPAAGVRSYAK